jgi:hypothetical protein
MVALKQMPPLPMESARSPNREKRSHNMKWSRDYMPEQPVRSMLQSGKSGNFRRDNGNTGLRCGEVDDF